MNKTYIDGDIQYSSIKLKSLDGQRTQDITNQCVSIDIYESILFPCIRAELYVYDAIDLLQGFPIIGEELVEFDWKSHSDEKDLFTKLIVVAVEEIEVDVANGSRTYVLQLCSEELYYAQKHSITAKYRETSATIVKSLLSELKTKKKLQNDSTLGIDDITLTNRNVLEAIDIVRRRAVSAKYKSSSFVFFETLRDGFHFRTLESIFEESKKNIGDRVYFYDTNTAEDVRQVNYRNVLAYEHASHGHTVGQVNRGALRNTVHSIDMITGEIVTNTYENEQYKKIDKNSKSLHTDTFTKSFEGNTEHFFLPVDGSLPELQLPEKVGKQIAFVENIVSSLVRIEVYGDSATTVGDVIELKLPEATGLTGSQRNKLLSGNYLISKCRHSIVFGRTRHYIQSLELIKGSYLT